METERGKRGKRGRPTRQKISPDTILNDIVDNNEINIDNDSNVDKPVNIDSPISISTGNINNDSVKIGSSSTLGGDQPFQNLRSLEAEIEDSLFAKKTQKQISDIAKVIEALYQQQQNTIKAIQQLLVKEISPSQGTEIQKVEQESQQGSSIPYWLEAIKNLKDITTNWAFITQQAMQGQPQQGIANSEQPLLEPLKMAMQTLKGFHQLYSDFLREVSNTVQTNLLTMQREGK